MNHQNQDFTEVLLMFALSAIIFASGGFYIGTVATKSDKAAMSYADMIGKRAACITRAKQNGNETEISSLNVGE